MPMKMSKKERLILLVAALISLTCILLFIPIIPHNFDQSDLSSDKLKAYTGVKFEYLTVRKKMFDSYDPSAIGGVYWDVYSHMLTLAEKHNFNYEFTLDEAKQEFSRLHETLPFVRTEYICPS